MARPSRTQSISTFILRFWRDRPGSAGDTGSHLVGRIEHIPSGRQRVVSNPEQMMGFIHDYVRDFGLERNDEGPTQEAAQPTDPSWRGNR